MTLEILPQFPGNQEKLTDLYKSVNWNITKLNGRSLSEENQNLVRFIVGQLEQLYRCPSIRLRTSLDFFYVGSHSNESFMPYDICMKEDDRIAKALQIEDALQSLLKNLPDASFWGKYKATERKYYPISGIVQELIGVRASAFSFTTSTN